MDKQKILIIDDEIDYSTILKGYFRKKNYDVFLAYTLKDGLDLLHDKQPDILFLDNNLPDGKGWTCVDTIVEKNPHLRVYLVSAYYQKGEFLSPFPNVFVWEKPLSMSLLNDNF
ncbi:MAG TPA: response regulator [Chitinophagaceae bacterium]|jgi:DNA-binding response OmpR family regulator|nr:response regulator [Chitinophagaceae bacterium]